MNPAAEICALYTESDNTSDVNYAILERINNTGGRIRAGLTTKQVTRFLAKIQRQTGCWEWQGARTPKGYGMFCAGRWSDGRQDTRYAHRVIYQLVKGEIPAGLAVLHRCDNPSCCNPDHLSLGTQHDNLMDASRKGRLPKTRVRRKARAA